MGSDLNKLERYQSCGCLNLDGTEYGFRLLLFRAPNSNEVCIQIRDEWDRSVIGFRPINVSNEEILQTSGGVSLNSTREYIFCFTHRHGSTMQGTVAELRDRLLVEAATMTEGDAVRMQIFELTEDHASASDALSKMTSGFLRDERTEQAGSLANSFTRTRVWKYLLSRSSQPNVARWLRRNLSSIDFRLYENGQVEIYGIRNEYKSQLNLPPKLKLSDLVGASLSAHLQEDREARNEVLPLSIATDLEMFRSAMRSLESDFDRLGLLLKTFLNDFDLGESAILSLSYEALAGKEVSALAEIVRARLMFKGEQSPFVWSALLILLRHRVGESKSRLLLATLQQHLRDFDAPCQAIDKIWTRAGA